MAWQFDTSTPIFKQISQLITKDIISGKYKSGDKLPTVRELAMDAGVNPNTMQRALSEIEASGLIYTKRGDGRYVSLEQCFLEDEATKHQFELAEYFVNSLKELGLGNEQILDLVKNQLQRGGE